jgi:hypothetical protein
MDRLVSPPLRRLHESDMLMNRAGIAPDDDGESLYQGTMLRFAWDIRLPPDSLIRFSLSFHY